MSFFRWIRVLYVNSPIAAYFARRRILKNPSPRRVAMQKQAAKDRARMKAAGVNYDRFDGQTWDNVTTPTLNYKSQIRFATPSGGDGGETAAAS